MVENLKDISQLKDREELLHESEKEFRIIIDQIEDGYAEVDLAGNLTFANNAVCENAGYTPDEFLGKNYREYINEETARAVYQAYNNVYTTGVPRKGITYEIIRKDGTRRIVENSVSLIKNAQGFPIGFRSVSRDITDRVRAEQELMIYSRRLEAIFRSVNDSIITVDNEMKVIDANEATERICGMPAKDITGKVFADCLHQCECNRSCHGILQDALKRKVTIKEYRIECNPPHRPQQVVIITISPLVDKGKRYIGTVFVIRDITEISDLKKELRERYGFHDMIGKSRKMQDTYRLLEELADIETTVLITGESGTGKNLVAKALHYGGRRAFKPIIVVNCSALAENLLESELFGHVRGAFTGATRDKQGRFQIANGGTIVLDEIGDISASIQLKLLRVIEEKEFERVGESVPTKVDIRIIACTNQDLSERVRMGKFREDLYYRFKVMEIALPPLRERYEDIPLLIDHFSKMFNKVFKKNIEGVSNEVLKKFMDYPWSGNIRELEHAIERSFILCHSRTITLEHIPTDIREYKWIQPPAFERNSAKEQGKILEALNKAGWNKAKASRLLGVSRQTLYRKFHQYRLTEPELI